ncbi:MAG: hypothetical protein QOE31_3049 [Solirubrobacteraceae bacterium]|jgi:hypothetical protein|nr:hypothetical protein [Solirubrobacteraceae bacterium]
MDAALAVITITTAVTVGVISVFLITRLVKTIRDLRYITVGLNDVLGWALGNVLGESRDGRVVDGSVAGTRKLGPG